MNIQHPSSSSSVPESVVQPPSQPCQICQSQNSKYTCPKCQIKTCSLTCSKSHKLSLNCTGIRNKSSYIPMNRYGWGSLMDDFCFLEDVGRKVGDVGREIVGSGFDMNVSSSMSTGRGRGRGRGRGGRGRERSVRGKGGKSKREILKMELDMLDIEMDLLPSGMERRNLNQSNWDIKYVLYIIFFYFS